MVYELNGRPGNYRNQRENIFVQCLILFNGLFFVLLINLPKCPIITTLQNTYTGYVRVDAFTICKLFENIRHRYDRILHATASMLLPPDTFLRLEICSYIATGSEAGRRGEGRRKALVICDWEVRKQRSLLFIRRCCCKYDLPGQLYK